MVKVIFLQDFEFILFFTIFVSFVVYVSGLAGYSIVSSSLENYQISDFSLNPLTAFAVFLGLMFTNSTYAVLGILLFVPYGLTMTYLGLKWLRGTG